MRRKLLSILALLCLTVSSAWADWTGGTYTATTDENLSGIIVNTDATLTINAGVTVTVTGVTGIQSGRALTVASGKTLTIVGPGTLTVYGLDGADGSDGSAGSGGVEAITGDIIVKGATVNAIGGAAGNGGNNSAGNGGKGAVGGRGLSNGTVTIYYGTINATGGKGGNGGNSTAGKGGNGGEGGYAIALSLTDGQGMYYYGGTVNFTSGVVGTGGTGTSGNGSDATRRKAFGNNYVTLMNTDATLTGDGTNITATTTPTVFGYYTVNIVPNEKASGSCGTSVNYSLTSDGVLTISGTGAMADYATSNLQPWKNNRTSITSIVVAEGVTHIGNSTFTSCTNATSVLLPTTLTSIGRNAFNGCNNVSLKSITIPNGVTSIGNYAFKDCSNLATVTLYSNPTIGTGAFTGIADGAAVTMNLTANAAGGAYWMTFYNEDYSFEADDDTQVFKARLGGSSITLHEVTDKIVDAGTAVVLKSSGNPVMTLTTSASSNEDSNSLEGVSDAAGQTSDGTMYVLNYKAATGVGFYKLASGKTLGVGKAYLTYSGSLAPEFLGFDGNTTGIKAIDNGQLTIDNEVYDLQGRRVTQPTKGLYIVNGKKVIIK